MCFQKISSSQHKWLAAVSHLADGQFYKWHNNHDSISFVHPLYRHWGSVQAVRPIGGVEVQLYSFMTTALEWGEGSASRPGRSLPRGKDPVPIVQEAGWAPGPFWTGAENLAPTGIRSLDRPARSQSLYRLSYPALWHCAYFIIFWICSVRWLNIWKVQ